MDVRSSALIENGRPSGVLLIARDVTDRKFREEEMRGTKEKYQMLVEGISDAIFEIDREGVFLYFSPIGKKIWGMIRKMSSAGITLNSSIRTIMASCERASRN